MEGGDGEECVRFRVTWCSDVGWSGGSWNEIRADCVEDDFSERDAIRGSDE